jgi:hypothetical protein
MRSPRLIVVCVLAMACDGSSGPSDTLCTAPVQVSVAPGSATQITWTPACRVQQVLVFESLPPSVGGPQLRWGVHMASAGIAPPLRYGQVPAGAQVILAAAPLVSGHPYSVQLSMDELVGNTTIVGEAGFVR